LLLLNYPELTGHSDYNRNTALVISLSILVLVYALVRYLKKTGRFRE
jgi:hypothetical protein